MPERTRLAADFLSQTPWARAHIAPLAGDASNRKYERLNDPISGKTAVLMDAPPEKGEDTGPFIHVANHLRKVGLSAPEILFEDRKNGFLIIEDLGDDLFSRVLKKHPDQERRLYTEATNVLIALRQAPPLSLKKYDPDLMTELACLAFSKYRDPVVGQSAQNAEKAFAEIFHDLLSKHTTGETVLAQRDYHADNLLWLPNRRGPERVGLLDFQDAMEAHPAYDLASLLQDVRRDVHPDTQTAMIEHYISETGCDDGAFRRAYTVLGAQRSLRILGVFGRLGKDYGKPHYVDMIPKVWSILMQNLRDPLLEPVFELLKSELPKPNADTLERLKPS